MLRKILTILFTLCFILSFAACAKTTDGDEFLDVKVSEDGILSWMKMTKATSYTVILGSIGSGTSRDITENSFDLKNFNLPEGSSKITITANKTEDFLGEKVEVEFAVYVLTVYREGNKYSMKTSVYSDEYITLTGFEPIPKDGNIIAYLEPSEKTFNIAQAIKISGSNMWGIFRDSEFNNEIKNQNLMGLNTGNNIFYIRITSSNGTFIKSYAINLYVLRNYYIRLYDNNYNTVHEEEIKENTNVKAERLYSYLSNDSYRLRDADYNLIERDAQFTINGHLTLYVISGSEAAEIERISQTYRYTVSNDGVTITEYKGSERFLTVEATIHGKAVKVIGENAFKNKTSLKEVILPEGITEIKAQAFDGCSELTKVQIPSTAQSIDATAFNNCSKLAEIIVDQGNTSFRSKNGILFNYALDEVVVFPAAKKTITNEFMGLQNITRVDIPNGVTTIGDYAFSGCSSLSVITIPQSVTSIGNYAFENCVSLKGISLPNNLTNLGSFAFKGSGLTGVQLPNGLTSISAGTFLGCDSLETVRMGNNIQNISFSAFEECTSLKDIILSSSLTIIGDNVFRGCESLKKISIPAGVTSIGSYAFYKCSAIEEITLPFVGAASATSIGSLFGADNTHIPASLKSVTIAGNQSKEIADNAFKDCQNITEIIIQSGITSIGSNAFKGCSGLKKIAISNSVTSIGDSALSGCTALEEITLPFVGDGSSNTHLGYIFGASNYSQNGSYIPASLKKVSVNGKGTTVIGNNAFRNCADISEITLQGISAIGSSAFEACTGLASITIPDTIESIGEYAFSGCTGLESISVPAGVTSIGKGAFYGCNALKEISLPFAGAGDSTNTHFGYIFGANNDSQNSSYVPSSLKRVTIYGGNVSEISNYAFSGCSEITNITINGGITKIGNYAFSGCLKLESFALPEGLTSIGNYAFSNCRALSGIIIPQSVTTIGNNAFSGCSGLLSVTIPSGVTSIGSAAFSGSSMIIYVAVSSKPSGWNDRWVSGIRAVVWGYSGTVVSEKVIYVESNGSYAVLGLKDDVEELTIPSTINGKSVTRILSRAFANSDLKSIEIPASVTHIDEYAFYYCKGLTTITLPASVTHIDEYAFYYCKGLTTITLPGSITDIGNYAFYGCDQLTNITIPSSVTYMGYGVFNSLTIFTKLSSKPSGWDSDWNISCPVVWGYNGTIEEDGIIYAENNGNLTVIGLKGSIEHLLIPANVKGKNVTEILAKAFQSQGSLKSVTISEGIAKIGDYAFAYCENLMSVTLPDTLSSIGEYAFIECNNLASITIPSNVTSIGIGAFSHCDILSQVTILGNITAIEDNTFNYCVSLRSVTIPNSVTKIAIYAFSDCWALEEITIPESVTRIEDYAFRSSGLITITIPASVTDMGRSVFDFCSKLVIYTKGSTYGWSSSWNGSRPYYQISENTFCEIDGMQFALKAGELYLAKYLGDQSVVEVPSSVTINGNTYPVSIIGDYSFYNINTLKSVIIPGSVDTIGANAFQYCEELTNVTLNEGLRRIATKSFDNCKSLRMIVIPSTVTNIASDSFSSNLIYYARAQSKPANWNGQWTPDYKVVYWGVTDSIICDKDDFHYILENGKAILTIYTGEQSDVQIPSSATINGVTYSVYGIGQSAFINCLTMRSVTIPSSVAVIRANAFRGCNNLTHVRIPATITEIGSNAFNSCVRLTIYTVASSKPSAWSTNWFSGRPVYWGVSDINYCEIDGMQFVIKDENATLTRYAGTNAHVEIPSSVTVNGNTYNVAAIGDYAFSYCDALESITIPSRVKSIGQYAFTNCVNLISVTIPASVIAIGDSAFSQCSSLRSAAVSSKASISKYMFYYCVSLTEVSIPFGVSSIGEYAFAYCNSLETLSMPDSVETVGSYAFYYCRSLKNITLSKTITSLYEYTFSNCRSLTAITIPDRLTSIFMNAFENCENLIYIRIPSTFRTLLYGFGNCRKLIIYAEGSKGDFYGWWDEVSRPIYWQITSENFCEIDGLQYVIIDGEAIVSAMSGTQTSVEIPSSISFNGNTYSVTAIGDYAFSYRSFLESVTIPDSVKSIGNYAFFSCDNLKNITMGSGMTSIGDYAFARCGMKKMVIPDSVTSIGSYAFADNTQLLKIVIPVSVSTIGDSVFNNCSNLVIYAEASSKPDGWKSSWNSGGRPVVWNYTD